MAVRKCSGVGRSNEGVQFWYWMGRRDSTVLTGRRRGIVSTSYVPVSAGIGSSPMVCVRVDEGELGREDEEEREIGILIRQPISHGPLVLELDTNSDWRSAL